MLAGLLSLLELGIVFQAPTVVNGIQFLVVVGLKPSAPRGHLHFPAVALSTGGSYHSNLLLQG